MTAPIVDLETEVAKAGKYPGQFNKREDKILECVKAYVDGADAALQSQIDDLGPILPAEGYASSLLGVYETFEVFGDTGITNSVGATTILGDVGVRTGGINGFPPGVITGNQHDGDATADAAYAAFVAAKATVAARGYSVDRTATPDLANQLLFPGVYKFDAACSISAGTLTLDANGNQNAQFIFNIGTTLTTAASITIILQNGARPDNVIWNVGTSATLGATNTFKGQIFAGTTVVLGNGTSVVGRLFSDTAVTLDTNVLDHTS